MVISPRGEAAGGEAVKDDARGREKTRGEAIRGETTGREAAGEKRAEDGGGDSGDDSDGGGLCLWSVYQFLILRWINLRRSRSHQARTELAGGDGGGGGEDISLAERHDRGARKHPDCSKFQSQQGSIKGQ